MHYSLYIGKEIFSKKVTKKIGRLKKNLYICTRNQGLTECTYKLFRNTLNIFTTMANNTLNNLVLATINAIGGGQQGVVVEMATAPNWQSKKNPYYGRVIKHTRIANIGLGVCYKNVVESHSDNKEEDFVPAEPRWGHYPTDSKGKIITRKYLISNTDPNQLYLNLVYRGNEKVTKEYILDGVLVIDKSVVADIESYLVVRKPSKKQLEHGVPQDKIVIVNQPKFENIALITHGDRVVYKRADIAYSIAL